MALLVNRDGYNSEFYPLIGDELDYILGNFWEKQTRTIEVEAETNLITTSGDSIDYKPAGYTNPDGLIQNLAQGFADFRM